MLQRVCRVLAACDHHHTGRLTGASATSLPLRSWNGFGWVNRWVNINNMHLLAIRCVWWEDLVVKKGGKKFVKMQLRTASSSLDAWRAGCIAHPTSYNCWRLSISHIRCSQPDSEALHFHLAHTENVSRASKISYHSASFDYVGHNTVDSHRERL